MEISGGKTEKGIIVGNAYDKYGSKNPIVRFLMLGFEKNLQDFLRITGATEIHEIGCGEGYWTMRWTEQGLSVKGSDFSRKVIDLAKRNALSLGLNIVFKPSSIYDLTPPIDGAELVVCCEVLEHLARPHVAVEVLRDLANPYAIFSVPREPIWRFMNIMRGKYISNFGNTPGHIQHWSKKSFVKMIKKYFTIVEVRTPLPWTMILAKNVSGETFGDG